MFHLFAQGTFTFDSLAHKLAEEGHVYSPSQPRFHRTILSYIFSNRFYIGEFEYHGRMFKGKHKLFISTETFELCQEILRGKNRRRRDVHMPMAGGLLRCRHCGQAITGEHIRRKLKSGGCNEHTYYRCGNDIQGADHPRVRWNGQEVEQAIESELNKLKLPSPDIADWLKDSVNAALADEATLHRSRETALKKRESELRNRQERLLTAYLDATIEKEMYETKAVEIKSELARVQADLPASVTNVGELTKVASAVIDLTQTAAERWRGSNWDARRELLDILSLNRQLEETNLCVTWASPFDAFAEMADIEYGRGDWI
jgi:hypothetical protein